MRPLDNTRPHFIPLPPRLLNWLFPGRELRTLQSKAHGFHSWMGQEVVMTLILIIGDARALRANVAM